jgi:DNA polymerase-3 subunit gamma/tau
LLAQARRIGPAEVVRVLDLLGESLEAVRAGADPRTQLELALVKAASPQADGSTRALLARIERLEQAVAGRPTPMAPPPAAPEPEPPSPSTAAEEPDEQAQLNGELDALWPAVLESVRAEHALLGAVFDEAAPSGVTEEELTLAFASSAAFLKRKAEDPANRAMLVEALRRLTGRRYRVAFELSEEPAASGGAPVTEEEIMARLVAELDAEELPEDWLAQQKGGD